MLQVPGACRRVASWAQTHSSLRTPSGGARARRRPPAFDWRGYLEAVIAVKSLEHRVVPPTINLEKADPLCDLDYVPGGARELPRMNTVLSNSFAIGGVNAALLFRRTGSS